MSKKGSLRSRTAAKLAQGNKTNTPVKLSTREKALVPKLALKPRSGFTGSLLEAQKARLKTVTSVNTPLSSNLDIIRSGTHTTHRTGAEFADFVQQTRSQLTTLASTESGKDLLGDISRGKHKVSIQDAGSQPGLRQNVKPDNFKDIYPSPSGKAGKGTGSVVSHHTDHTQRFAEKRPEYGGKSPKEIEGVGFDSATALGHELIHAAHISHGVIRPEVSGAKLRPEEKETVGKSTGKRGVTGMPTENSIRRDMTNEVYKGGSTVKAIPARKTYGGQKVD